MISTVVFFSLFAATTTSALEFHSPIHVVRPLNDVHDTCDDYVSQYCSQIDTNHEGVEGGADAVVYAQLQDALKDVSEDTDSENPFESDTANLPAWVVESHEAHLQDKWIAENGNPRRLNEVKPEKEGQLRKVSVSLSVRITPKNAPAPVQRAKNNKRFLNYGQDGDKCLWDAFDSKKIPSPCASALTYVNESVDSMPLNYEPNRKTSTVSVSFSGFTLCSLILCCYLIALSCSDEEEIDPEQLKDDDDECNDYEPLVESKNTAFVMVPVRVV